MAGKIACNYAELGLPVGASIAHVKRAFFQLARRCHPDKCDAPSAAERFRRARAAFEALTSTNAPRETSEICFQDDDSDSWEPPPPRKEKSPPPTELEPDEPDPILSLSELIASVVNATDEDAQSVKFRRRFLQAGISWPWNSMGSSLRTALVETLRDDLDHRIQSNNWCQLSKKDLVWWLESHGCTLTYALEDDAVDEKQLQKLVKSHFVNGKIPDATKLPTLTKISEELMGAKQVESILTALPADTMPKIRKHAKDNEPSKRPKISSPPSETIAVATVEDCMKLITQASQRGKGKEGVELLLQKSKSGEPFRGKRIVKQNLRSALLNLKKQMASSF